VSRILVYESRPSCDDCLELLKEAGRDVVVCRNRDAVLDAFLEGRPDVVVYVLGDLPTDLVVLSLLRRVGPTLPIIVLGGPSSLDTRRSVQDLKPTYFGVLPLDPLELRDAVQGALDSRLRWSR
jgi:DNA-binding response OmpR family regulator